MLHIGGSSGFTLSWAQSSKAQSMNTSMGRKAAAPEQSESMQPNSYNVRGAVWIILYSFFVLAPLFALLAGSLPPPRDFWTEFSVAIGYAGLAMMGLQFGLTARFR